MKFRPILFSTAMVKAILDESKTQTRRAIKPQPNIDDDSGYVFFKDEMLDIHAWKEEMIERNAKIEVDDILWVRETWAEVGNFASAGFSNSEVIGYKTQEAFFYPHREPLDTESWNWDMIKWKPSIFMPKDVCRIFLKCTNVRVERLLDISEEDAKAEGIEIGDGFEQFKNYQKGYPWKNSAIESFFSLWESINGKESLEKNPWVWVYDFEKVERPLNFK